jgi:DNA-binding NtrC family response regulator
MKTTLYPTHPILFVDDEKQFLLSLELTMSSNGLTNTETCSDSREVVGLLDRRQYSLLVLDMNMPHIPGLDLLTQIMDRHPDMRVIVVTAVNDVGRAVACMKKGAYDYVLKPADDMRLVAAIRHGLEFEEVRIENEMLKESLLRDSVQHPEAFSAIITHSSAIQHLFQYIEAIGRTSLPILITGETGTGKELFAAAIHRISERSGELVTVNVAGVDDNLFSDTLFGHRKGAFTGADSERKGLIEKAENGTLFLDEIGDLSIESQVKLLRLLQDGQYYPLGSDVARLSNARIIVATHRDIRSMQANDKFRKDLYYRLKSHHIAIPPLHERKEDIPFLANQFIAEASQEMGKKKPTVPKELYTLLNNYQFSGNVRELRGMIYEAIGLHGSGVLSLDSIRKQIGDDQSYDGEAGSGLRSESDEDVIVFPGRFPTLREAEEFVIQEAMRRADQNQTIAAELLGMSRRALNNRLRRKPGEVGE